MQARCRAVRRLERATSADSPEDGECRWADQRPSRVELGTRSSACTSTSTCSPAHGREIDTSERAPDSCSMSRPTPQVGCPWATTSTTRPDRRVEEVDDVRPDVEQGAHLHPPWCRERPAQERGRGTPRRQSPRLWPPHRGTTAPPFAEAEAEHDQGSRSRLADHVTTMRYTPAASTPSGFSSRSAFPARATASANSGCTVGATHSATASQLSSSSSNGLISPRHPKPRGRPFHVRHGPRPHTGERRLGTSGQHGHMRRVRPRPRPDQPHLQRDSWLGGNLGEGDRRGVGRGRR